MLLKTNPFNIENNNSLGRTIGFHFDSVCLYFVNKITTTFVIKTLCMHSMHTHTYTHPVRDRERERKTHSRYNCCTCENVFTYTREPRLMLFSFSD